MKPSTVWSLAVVLTKSQLRSYQRSKLAKWFGNPNVIFILDALLVGILGTIGYYLISNLPQELLTTAGRLEVEVLIGIPTITTFVIILFGILTELSQPIQSTSADLVNWLPITPSEYVLGSTLSLSYTYSFLLAFFLGLALGPALYFAHGLILAVSAIMGIIALFIGSSAVELIRAVTNRISSSFYRKSGRSGIFATGLNNYRVSGLPAVVQWTSYSLPARSLDSNRGYGMVHTCHVAITRRSNTQCSRKFRCCSFWVTLLRVHVNGFCIGCWHAQSILGSGTSFNKTQHTTLSYFLQRISHSGFGCR